MSDIKTHAFDTGCAGTFCGIAASQAPAVADEPTCPACHRGADLVACLRVWDAHIERMMTILGFDYASAYGANAVVMKTRLFADLEMHAIDLVSRVPPSEAQTARHRKLAELGDEIDVCTSWDDPTVQVAVDSIANAVRECR